ncbi:MAG: hypothetical protein GY832_36560 [Chloroflexi bacterium]|nr:hypothetical protein [Chloroflexota bacterium]
MSANQIPSARQAAFSAFRAGSLRSVTVRPSSRAASGVVLVAAFASFPRARSFARRWAFRLGFSVVVRRSGGVPLSCAPSTGWAVSVPVVIRARCRWLLAGGGIFAPVVGGLRGLLAVVSSWGLA